MAFYKQLNIVLIEPFFTGSHKAWADGYKKNSNHNINILFLKGKHWKWRMHGGAITLGKLYQQYIVNNGTPDLLLVTDMLNLPVFISLVKLQNIPVISFFHENQLTYPWSTQDRDKEKNRDHHYGFINYTTTLCSNKIMFNSDFHKNSFITALIKFLKMFPDHQQLSNVDIINNKSVVSYLGLDLKKFDKYKKIKKNKTPIILWNHRWEYDKNPNDFFNTLFKINNKKIDFSIVILGEKGKEYPKIFDKAKEKLKDKILHFGYCKSEKEYRDWLLISDILPVTSIQDFFGVSIIEAVSSCVYPILPNRLAYPEILSIDKNKKLFYNSKQELKNKIEYVIINIDLIRQDSLQLSKFVINRYSWGKMAPAYDKRFNLIK